MLNHFIFMGRLTKDPELRQTAKGIPVCSWSVACERDREENGMRPVDFFDCVAWRSTAEFVNKYFQKGRMIVCEGRVHQRTYANKEGVRVTRVEMHVEQVYFGDSKKPDAPAEPVNIYAASAADIQGAASYKQPPTDFAELPDDDSELPF